MNSLSWSLLHSTDSDDQGAVSSSHQSAIEASKPNVRTRIIPIRADVLNPLVVNQAHSLRNLCDAKTAFSRRAGWTDESIFSTSSSSAAAAGSRRPQRRQNHEAMNKDRPPPPPFGSFFPPQRTDIPQEARTHALKGGTFALQRGSQTSPVILATTHSSSQNGKRSRKLPKDSDTVVF